MQERTWDCSGVKLHAMTNTSQHQFCASLYIRAGSLFETMDQSGITHLFEHMVFRNLKRKYGGAFYDLLQLNGLYFSGCTYREFLRFSIEGPAFGYAFAVDVLCSVFDEIAVSTEEFANEKARIKAEIRERDERNSLEYAFLQNVWKGTNNVKTVLGYCKVIDRVSLKGINAYRTDILSTDNCFFYVTGNVDEDGLALLRERISALPVEHSCTQRRNVVVLSGHFFHREAKVLAKNGDWCALQFGFDIDAARHPGGVVDLIYGILFKGENGLLHTHLSEDDPLIYSFDSVREQYNNVGNLQFDFEVEPYAMEEAVLRVADAIRDLKEGNFNFDANLRAEQAMWLMDLDNPARMNWSLAYLNHILCTEPLCYENGMVSRLKNVTKEAVQQAAADIFRRENLTLAVKGNRRKIKIEAIEKLLEAFE